MVIGGTSIYGGKGTVVGILIGSIILGMINNGLMFGFCVNQQIIFWGGIVLVAVALSPKDWS